MRILFERDHGKDPAVVDSHLDVDMPNEIGSAKDVAGDLVDGDEADAVIHRPKSQPKKSAII
jgi:hypothetical protein